LGTELSLLMDKSRIPFIGTDREIDITDKSAIEDYARAREISTIINCAAYTAVDKAEDEFDACNHINMLGAGNIASCASKIGARLIHISTDYVFDGNGITDDTGVTRPYREDDETNPIGVYGATKRFGEIAVMGNNPNSFIIRTAWLYGRYGSNFVHTMLRLMNERDEISVVDDQRGSPTWAYDLASAIISFEKMDIPFGIYHYSNDGNITWLDFAKEIYRQGREMGLIKKSCQVTGCTSVEYPARVKRPAYSVLDKSKIKSALHIDIPSWESSLKDYLATCAL